MTTTTNAALAAQVTALLTKWNASQAQLSDWMAGAPDGGPNGDGTFPLTNASGDTALYLSLPKLVDLVDGPAALAEASRVAAEAAATLADNHRMNAVTARTAAEAAQASSVTLRAETQLFRDEAAAFWAQVGAAQTDVSTKAAQATLDAASALASADIASEAATAAALSEDAAAASAALAQDYAEAVNPVQFVTFPELDAAIANVVGQAPETMNALDELAAAMGNDPNFATTVMEQLGGKAPLVHTHVISDIGGLQAALDGKQAAGSYALASHTHSYLPLTGGTLTGALTAPSVTMPTANAGKVRLFSLASLGVGHWGAFALNANYAGGWFLDDAAKDGWYFNLDARGTSGNTNGLFVFQVPAGAGDRTSVQQTKFGVTPTYVHVADAMSIGFGGANVVAPTSGYKLDINGAIKATGVTIGGAAAAVLSDITWANLGGKPSTFAPSAHGHDWSEVTGKPATFAPAAHGHDWSEVTGKPATFAPSAHTHAWADIVSGKPTTLAGYGITDAASSGHNHDGVYAAAGHDHAGVYAVAGHDHAGVYEPAFAAGTSAQYRRGDKTWQTLNKAAVGLSNVDNTSDASKPVSTATQTALNGKANSAHTHTDADITLTQSLGLNGYVKLPGGVILQWGTITVAANSTATWTYPTAFTTTSRCIVSGGPVATGTAGQVHTRSTTTTSASIANTDGTSITAFCFAIGY